MTGWVLRRRDGLVVETDDRKIWQLFAENFHLFLGTPTGVWLRDELADVFGVDEKLTGANAQAVYDAIAARLATPSFRPRALFEQFGIEVLATTDAATDPLEHHQAIGASDWEGRVIPTFRPDSVVNLDAPNWRSEIDALSEVFGDRRRRLHLLYPGLGGPSRIFPENGRYRHRPCGPQRLHALLDEGELEFHDEDLGPVDALGFVDSKPYDARITASQKKVGRKDAFVAVSGKLAGIEVEVGCFDFKFMGGSMGSVVGELITRVYERAAERGRPAIVISASGGARMQEGVLSLMQMAKTCAALAKLQDEANMPYISVLTHPTTGGVAASFAMLGDLILAEPGALIGFAGPRVIEQTIGQSLPEGFQTSEYLLEHGMVDRIVSRTELRDVIASTLRMMLGLPGVDEPAAAPVLEVREGGKA